MGEDFVKGPWTASVFSNELAGYLRASGRDRGHDPATRERRRRPSMKSLGPPDSHHLNAAEGWLGLGNAVEAQRELEKIAPDMRHHPEVLRLEYHLHERAKQWEHAAETAQRLCQLFPETAFGWIHFAYALHELKRTREAYDALLPVVNRFPEEHVILYNLACYSCQMGRLEEARAWLDKAMALAGPETIKQMALGDSDLQAMRAEIERM